MNLVSALQEDPAISPLLTVAHNVGVLLPLHVKLAIPKLLTGVKISASSHYLHNPVDELPFGRTWVPIWVIAIDLTPLIEIFAIEENDSVGRRRTERGPGINFGRIGARWVMNMPRLAGKHGSVFVAITPNLGDGRDANTGREGAGNEKAGLASGAGSHLPMLP